MTDQQTVFDSYEKTMAARDGGTATAKMKQACFTQARTDGFPTNKAEDWRYSDLGDLRASAFTLSDKAAADVASDSVASLLTESACKIVFVNGVFSEALSQNTAKSDGFSVETSADSGTDLVKGKGTVTLLNTALTDGCTTITVPAGSRVDLPIEIIHLSHNSDSRALMTRLIVNVGDNASATIVERFSGADTDNYWTSSLMQVAVSEKASLTHYKLQEEGAKATHTSSVYVSADTASQYKGFNLQTGGKYGRMEHHVAVNGEEADIRIDGANLSKAGQTLDVSTHVDHRVPNSVSDQIFRSVVAKKGKSAFQGKVTVAVDAQKTLADQSCRALLLDRTAEANAKPELEIYADDVKCSHGATVGELDEKAYFYMLARGIDPATARRILVEAFAADALAHIEDSFMRDLLNARILNWMESQREA